jgi:hypothetical protein
MLSALVGGVLGAFAILAVVVAAVFMYWRRKKKGETNVNAKSRGGGTTANETSERNYMPHRADIEVPQTGDDEISAMHDIIAYSSMSNSSDGNNIHGCATIYHDEETVQTGPRTHERLGASVANMTQVTF